MADTNTAAPVGVTHTPGSESLPDITMIVREGSTVKNGDDVYYGGDEITVDAPTAMHFQQSGVADAKLDE